jgi:signal transduction histidine kinase
MPRWVNSIRFRLSLTYALAVFTVGALFVAGVYLWQLNRLNEPLVVRTEAEALVQNPVTGEVTRLRFLMQDELDRLALEELERMVNARALEQLRQVSLMGLGLMSVVAFGLGWVLSGWALRPMGRMAAVARDISANELSRRIALQGPDDELKDLADTFDEMLDRLQISFEGQRRFIQDASHELRNPLATAQANLELVLGDPHASSEDLRRSARIAHESAGRVSHIVDDLLAQARNVVPRIAVGPVDLALLARDVVAEMEAAAAGRQLTLVAGGTGVVVHGDGPALRRAVTNLVANSVRLAPAGTTITVTTGIDHDRATISVRDEGPGIEPEHHRSVFERFWRGPDSGKGLGLGLSIVRQVAQRHGGTVELISQEGQGSTFVIAVPVPTGPPQPEAPDGTRRGLYPRFRHGR